LRERGFAVWREIFNNCSNMRALAFPSAPRIRNRSSFAMAAYAFTTEIV